MDPFSVLPDTVLIHLLSLLPTTADVLRAGAVNTRWRRLSATPSLFATVRFPELGAHAVKAAEVRCLVERAGTRLRVLDLSSPLCAVTSTQLISILRACPVAASALEELHTRSSAAATFNNGAAATLRGLCCRLVAGEVSVAATKLEGWVSLARALPPSVVTHARVGNWDLRGRGERELSAFCTGFVALLADPGVASLDACGSSVEWPDAHVLAAATALSENATLRILNLSRYDINHRNQRLVAGLCAALGGSAGSGARSLSQLDLKNA